MSSKGRSKGRKKDSQLIIRINRLERDAFVSLCEDEDTSGAREIRRFIRSYLEEHEVDLSTIEAEAETEAELAPDEPATE